MKSGKGGRENEHCPKNDDCYHGIHGDLARAEGPGYANEILHAWDSADVLQPYLWINPAVRQVPVSSQRLDGFMSIKQEETHFETGPSAEL